MEIDVNLHNPARYPSESMADYRARRAASRTEAKALTAHGVNKGLQNSRASLRDAMRRNGTMGKRTRAYVALMAAWASKRVISADRFRTGDGKNKRGNGLH